MYNKKDYVSIILPTYNRANVIMESIRSVLEQTYPYFELIILDDGSTDHTEQIVENLCNNDNRVKYIRLEENGGQSKARNIGMKLAEFDYIAFQDSDDFWRKEKLEKQMNAIKDTEDHIGFVYHNIRYDMGNKTYCIIPDETFPIEVKSGKIFQQLLVENLIGMPTLLLKKNCLQDIGYLDESLRSLEDYDFALRLAKKYEAIFLNEILLDAEYSLLGVSGCSTQYLVSSCMILGKYKKDYLATNTFEHRLNIILRGAAQIGKKNEIIKLLEKILSI